MFLAKHGADLRLFFTGLAGEQQWKNPALFVGKMLGNLRGDELLDVGKLLVCVWRPGPREQSAEILNAEKNQVVVSLGAAQNVEALDLRS